MMAFWPGGHFGVPWCEYYVCDGVCEHRKNRNDPRNDLSPSWMAGAAATASAAADGDVPHTSSNVGVGVL